MWRFRVILGKKWRFTIKIMVAPKVAILGNFCGDLAKNHLKTLLKTYIYLESMLEYVLNILVFS